MTFVGDTEIGHKKGIQTVIFFEIILCFLQNRLQILSQ